MDIKAKIDEIVEKIKADPDLAKEFQADPVKTVEKLAGVDLPDDKINPVIEGIKAKIQVDGINGIIGKIGGLFGGNK